MLLNPATTPAIPTKIQEKPTVKNANRTPFHHNTRTRSQQTHRGQMTPTPNGVDIFKRRQDPTGLTNVNLIGGLEALSLKMCYAQLPTRNVSSNGSSQKNWG